VFQLSAYVIVFNYFHIIRIMKNSIKLLAAIAMFGFAGTASAQSSATATATASATIICPIHIVKNADLNFGNVVAGTGTATIAATSGATDVYSNPQLNPGPTNLGTQTPASFTVTGQSGYTYSRIQSAVTGAIAANLVLNNVPAVAPATAGTLTGGTDTFYVGGVLTVTGLAAGNYTGTFDETVAYN
jgi:hypothetical protein